jgi:hypothetical protein
MDSIGSVANLEDSCSRPGWKMEEPIHASAAEVDQVFPAVAVAAAVVVAAAVA